MVPLAFDPRFSEALRRINFGGFGLIYIGPEHFVF